MRAVMVHRPGGPEALQPTDVPSPEPEPGQVRVDVAAAGVNFIDIYHRTGKYPLPLPFVAGSEGAGVVSATGPGVEGVGVGDRVAWAMVPGTGYAEQVLVPADRLAPVPDAVPTQTAAAVMLQGLTAHYLTRSTYPVRDGDTVLVPAAAGGLGLLLTQVAVARGARVIGTTSTEAKAELARDAGAGDVLVLGAGQQPQLDLAARVRELTGGRGVDVVYDGVGRATFLAGLDCLRRRGTMVLVGAASGAPDPLDPAVLGAKGSLFLTRPSLAHHVADRGELLQRAADLLGWVGDGTLRVRVGGRYPLDAAADAHRDLEARRSTGKLLVVPGG